MGEDIDLIINGWTPSSGTFSWVETQEITPNGTSSLKIPVSKLPGKNTSISISFKVTNVPGCPTGRTHTITLKGTKDGATTGCMMGVRVTAKRPGSSKTYQAKKYADAIHLLLPKAAGQSYQLSSNIGLVGSD